MNRTSARGRSHSGSSRSMSSTLRQELAEQYPELSAQSVATALDQAARAAALLMYDTDDTGTGDAGLVAMLARDRLNAQRERHAAAARRIDRHRSSTHARIAR